jgi:hypothetical protein
MMPEGCILKGFTIVLWDEALVINIPVEDQPPTGGTAQLRWEIKIVEKDAP